MIRKIILKIFPDSLINFYKALKKERKAQQRLKLEKQHQGIDEQAIINTLKKFGIQQGDTLMLHASLSKLGLVNGGAQSVISAILKAIGPQGNLAMPAFPASGFNFDYLSTNPIFDVNNTVSKTGIISEVFRQMPGVRRSLHPTDSVCALGPQAGYLTQDHFNQLSPYNENSPFYRLCALNAKIIMLGVDLNSLTNLHTLEDAVQDFKFPVYHSHIFECEIIDHKGIKHKVKTKAHDPKWSKKRKCQALFPHFKQAGFLQEGALGKASVYVITAAEMHKWMLDNYYQHGITMYTPHGEE